MAEGRLPDFTQLDLHAQYNFKRLTRQNFTLVVDVLNALNTRTALAVQEKNITMGSIRFGDPLEQQRPFAVRLGLYYVY